ncbi:MAG: hypothetical protein WCX65_11200 [bacterium]
MAILKYIAMLLFYAVLTVVVVVSWQFGLDLYQTRLRQHVLSRLTEAKAEITE